MTVSRPSLRIRRGRWRTRALAASPTAAEPTARCSTGVRRAPKNSSAMTRSCSSHCSASSADLGAGARASNSSARRRAVRRWTGMLPRSISRLGVSMALLSISTHHHAQVRAVMSSTTLPVCPKTGSTSPSLTVHLCLHTAPGNRECAPPSLLETNSAIRPGNDRGVQQVRLPSGIGKFTGQQRLVGLHQAAA